MKKTVADKKMVVGDGTPGPGRPKGSKDKKWANLEYWYELVINEWSDIKPTDRAWIAMAAFKALLGRSQAVLTPDESVHNVEKAMATLKLLEEAGEIVANRGRGQGSYLHSLEERTASIQASTATEEGLRRDQGVTS